MVDNTNPTSQFHPYTPVDATPQSEKRSPSGLKGMLDRVGIDTNNLGALGDKLKNVDVQQSLGKVRSWAQSNPAMALGGLAAVAIGAGLLRRRTS